MSKKKLLTWIDLGLENINAGSVAGSQAVNVTPSFSIRVTAITLTGTAYDKVTNVNVQMGFSGYITKNEDTPALTLPAANKSKPIVGVQTDESKTVPCSLVMPANEEFVVYAYFRLFGTEANTIGGRCYIGLEYELIEEEINN